MVIIVSVVRNQATAASRIGSYHVILLKLEESLKHRVPWIPGTDRNLLLSDPSLSKTLVPGTHWIMLLAHNGFINDRQIGVEFGHCPPMPATQTNLEIVKRGVAMDDRPLDLD